MTASTPRRLAVGSRTTGIPPPPLAITTKPASTSACTAGASRISSGSGEATTRRHPFSPRSSQVSPCSTRRAASSAGRNRPIGLVGLVKPGSSRLTSARVTRAADAVDSAAGELGVERVHQHEPEGRLGLRAAPVQRDGRYDGGGQLVLDQQVADLRAVAVGHHHVGAGPRAAHPRPPSRPRRPRSGPPPGATLGVGHGVAAQRQQDLHADEPSRRRRTAPRARPADDAPALATLPAAARRSPGRRRAARRPQHAQAPTTTGTSTRQPVTATSPAEATTDTTAAKQPQPPSSTNRGGGAGKVDQREGGGRQAAARCWCRGPAPPSPLWWPGRQPPPRPAPVSGRARALTAREKAAATVAGQRGTELGGAGEVGVDGRQRSAARRPRSSQGGPPRQDAVTSRSDSGAGPGCGPEHGHGAERDADVEDRHDEQGASDRTRDVTPWRVVAPRQRGHDLPAHERPQQDARGLCRPRRSRAGRTASGWRPARAAGTSTITTTSSVASTPAITSWVRADASMPNQLTSVTTTRISAVETRAVPRPGPARRRRSGPRTPPPSARPRGW